MGLLSHLLFDGHSENVQRARSHIRPRGSSRASICHEGGEPFELAGVWRDAGALSMQVREEVVRSSGS